MSFKVSAVHGREVLDSRGNPTLEVEMTLADSSFGLAMVPSGASTGEHEALELRDGGKRYGGKGVQRAVENVNQTLAKQLVGRDFATIQTLDQAILELDGTSQKSKYGANTLLGISLAFAQAAARSRRVPLYTLINEWMGLRASDLCLPTPLMNILNGGMHANNGLEIQEFMIVPHGFETFGEALRAGTEVFHQLKSKLHKQHLSTAVGDEGGFAPSLESNDQAIEFICDAVKAAGYSLGSQISLALDVASSSFFNKATGRYDIRQGGKSDLSSDELIGYYEKLLQAYPIVSIEDGLDENDWAGWKNLTSRLGQKTQLVGDDLFVTQKAYVEKGIEQKAANAVLIKVNQVGTLSETLETMSLCRAKGYRAIASHRSGETEDVTISHLAVGSGCGQIKTGSASRGERTAKYNELLRIEERAKLAGHPIFFRNAFK